jgi:hypothetical protein
MDESFLYNIFVGTNQLVSVKLIRNRATGASEGAPPAAQQQLQLACCYLPCCLAACFVHACCQRQGTALTWM